MAQEIVPAKAAGIVPSWSRPKRIVAAPGQSVGTSEVKRLVRIGKMHLGETRKKMVSDGKGGQREVEYPVDLDYFKFDAATLQRWPEITKLYGERPNRLDIIFSSDNIEDVFPQAYKLYGKSRGLKCTGDGKTATRWLCSKCHDLMCKCKGERSVEQITVPCTCDWYTRRICKPIGNLMFMLYKLHGGMSGVFQVDTSSYNSMVDVNNGFAQLSAFCGGASGVPLVLTRAPRTCHPNGGELATVKHMLQIACELTIQELLTIKHKGAAQFLVPELASLSTKEEEDNALTEIQGKPVAALPEPEGDQIGAADDNPPEEAPPEEVDVTPEKPPVVAPAAKGGTRSATYADVDGFLGNAQPPLKTTDAQQKKIRDLCARAVGIEATMEKPRFKDAKGAFTAITALDNIPGKSHDADTAIEQLCMYCDDPKKGQAPLTGDDIPF